LFVPCYPRIQRCRLYQSTPASQQDHLVCIFCFSILDSHSNNGTTRIG
jgi:hypothetical protein